MHRMRRLTHFSHQIHYSKLPEAHGRVCGITPRPFTQILPSCLQLQKNFSRWWYLWPRSTSSSQFFSPPNLAAFIVLKVTKQVTSAHIVQKLQSPAVRFMFRVSLPVFLYLQLLTPHYWSNSRTQWQSMLIDKDGIIFGKLLDYGNKGGEVISVNNWHTYCRQPQQIVLFPPIPATCFSRTGHFQALNTWYLTLKIKCIFI